MFFTLKSVHVLGKCSIFGKFSYFEIVPKYKNVLTFEKCSCCQKNSQNFNIVLKFWKML